MTVPALEAALNPALLFSRQAALAATEGAAKAGRGGGGGSTAGSAKAAAQLGLWRLLVGQAAEQGLLTFRGAEKMEAAAAAEAAGGAVGADGGGAWATFGLLQRLFPVVCLTPEEAAAHLPAAGAPGGCPFDVVLFDEASQLPTLEVCLPALCKPQRWMLFC